MHNPAFPTARVPDGTVVALRPLDPAAPWLPAWRALARAALVDNLFFEPDFAHAAAPAFGEGVHLLMAGDRPPEEPGLRLLALWPCRIRPRRWTGLPVLAGWSHGFGIFGAPLIGAEAPEQALRALLDAPQHLGLPPRLAMPYLPLDGPFAEMLERLRAERGLRRVDLWQHARGYLDLANRDAAARAAYLAGTLSVSKGRQLARQRRRLAAVQHETVRRPEALGPALDDYIALEAAGWKGRSGTAVGHRPREVAFLHALVAAYGARGEFRIDRLRRGGTSLAASIALRTGASLWYLKISHDEAEARNSPGAQLVRDVTRSILDDPGITAADSCAPPDLRLIETFWGERRRLAFALIEAGGGDRWFPLCAGLERLRAAAARHAGPGRA